MNNALEIKINEICEALNTQCESLSLKDNKLYISALADKKSSSEVAHSLLKAKLEKAYPDYSILLTFTAPKQVGKKPEKLNLPNIKKIIAISSGKGGVGKSTIASQTAYALAKSNPNLNIGILDADIYGPSIPTMFNLSGKPEMNDAKKLIPFRKDNLQIMSMGFMVDLEQPIIWRGPMIQTGIKQLFKDVAWDNIDIMIVDMPPGTGDTQLTMAQSIPLTSAIIVSTPQDIALIDARKGWNMYKKLGIPILGLIENMSYFTCTNCHHDHHIFGHNGAKIEAEKHDILFLGNIPLDIQIREKADCGEFLPDMFTNLIKNL